ncbi:MAG: hypothetical protein ABJL99_24640 [Aliishimia sp.]
MMQAIGGAGFPPSQAQKPVKMTEEQGQKLADLLSQYDAENLSDEDAEDIVSQIKELGIEPGAGLATGLADAGFDARGLAEQAGIAGNGPPGGGPPDGGSRPKGPPPGGSFQGVDSVDSAAVSLIADVVESFQNSDETDSLWDVLEPALQDAGYDTSQSIIDFYS